MITSWFCGQCEAAKATKVSTSPAAASDDALRETILAAGWQRGVTPTSHPETGYHLHVPCTWDSTDAGAKLCLVTVRNGPNAGLVGVVARWTSLQWRFDQILTERYPNNLAPLAEAFRIADRWAYDYRAGRYR
jgi:hypothetical protein